MQYFRCFASRDSAQLVRAFVTWYVRPLLEYNCLTWSPYLMSDIRSIEKLQRRFTKRLTGLRTSSYHQRLEQLNMPSRELRLICIDLIRCYKIVFRLIDMTCDDFHLSSSTIKRGRAYKIYKPNCMSSIRAHFFAKRVINVWNSLPRTVNFTSLKSFKRSLDCIDIAAHL